MPKDSGGHAKYSGARARRSEVTLKPGQALQPQVTARAADAQYARRGRQQAYVSPPTPRRKLTRIIDDTGNLRALAQLEPHSPTGDQVPSPRKHCLGYRGFVPEILRDDQADTVDARYGVPQRHSGPRDSLKL